MHGACYFEQLEAFLFSTGPRAERKTQHFNDVSNFKNPGFYAKIFLDRLDFRYLMKKIRVISTRD